MKQGPPHSPGLSPKGEPGSWRGRRSLRSRACWIAVLYACFATLWIYFSDKALSYLIPDPAEMLKWSVYKGLAFVATTSLLLLLLMRWAFGKIETGYHTLKNHETEIKRLTRLYAALSQINQAIVWAREREALLQKICDLLIQHGGFRMAWIGWHEHESHRLLPVAQAGDENGYLETIRIYGDDRPEGRGPSGITFRQNRPYVCNDILKDPVTLPWRAEMVRRGYQASAVFPICMNGRPCATLSVYANEKAFFQDKEIELLSEAVTNISFALENLERTEEHHKAEVAVQNEKLFSDTMIESMPGILYFYNDQGKFLRWNKNFETVSGYSASEIADMHPLDFFSTTDKRPLDQRIRDVFEKGESYIEAPFLCKDGNTVPYFFTGKRVVYNDTLCLVGVGIDIRARVQAEASQRESLARFHAIAQATNDAVWDWNLNNNTIWWSDNFRAYFRYQPEQIEPGIEFWTTRVHPDDKERVIGGIHAVIDGTGKHWSDEYRFLRGDGTYAEVFDRGLVLRDDSGKGVRMVGAIQDISERKKAEAALRESEARYRTLFEQAPDGIIIADLNGTYLDANASICGMLGYPREELIGRNATDIVTPAEVRNIGPALERIRTSPDYHREWQFRRKDGSVFPAEVIAAKMPDGHLLAMIRDITERKQSEAALRELNENLEHKVSERTIELEKAMLQAEAADRIKSAFLATMSHELRTPLNSIIGFTGIVLQELPGPLNPEQTKQLNMVRNSARHLLELINDVLDISKIEAGQLQVLHEPFELPASINRAIALVSPLAEKKGLRMECRISPELGNMTGDKRRVEQILINLLNNAIKFTEQGEVQLTAEKITSPAAGKSVRIQISDTGIGIKPDDLASLFQPFRQIDSGISRQHDGTGLGLAICLKLATLMHGKVSATSEWGQGSTFSLTLPLESANTGLPAP